MSKPHLCLLPQLGYLISRRIHTLPKLLLHRDHDPITVNTRILLQIFQQHSVDHSHAQFLEFGDFVIFRHNPYLNIYDKDWDLFFGLFIWDFGMVGKMVWTFFLGIFLFVSWILWDF